MQTRIKLEKITVFNFDPKKLLATLEISFYEGEKHHKLVKEITLKHPESLFNQLLLEIKSKNKILLDDIRFNPIEKLEFYSPIIIEKGEEVEVKVYNFLKFLCEKASSLKKTKEAYAYIKLLNEFKTISLQL